MAGSSQTRFAHDTEAVSSGVTTEAARILQNASWEKRLEAAREMRAKVLAEKGRLGRKSPAIARTSPGPARPAPEPADAMAQGEREVAERVRGLQREAQDTARRSWQWLTAIGALMATLFDLGQAALAPVLARARERRVHRSPMSDAVRGFRRRIGAAVPDGRGQLLTAAAGLVAALALAVAVTHVIQRAAGPRLVSPPLATGGNRAEEDSVPVQLQNVELTRGGPVVDDMPTAWAPSESPPPPPPAETPEAAFALSEPEAPVAATPTAVEPPDAPPAPAADDEPPMQEHPAVQETAPEPAPITDAIEAAVADAMSDPVIAAGSVHVFFQQGIPEERVSLATSALAGAGLTPAQPQAVSFAVSRDQVRFYHREDRTAADLIAQATGAEVRDFTDYRPLPTAGTVELWLSGD